MDGKITSCGRETVSGFYLNLHHLTFTFRLEIQAKVRQLGRNPGTFAQQAIELAREQLTVLLRDLKSAMHDGGVVEVNGTTNLGYEPLAIWDDIMNEPVPAGPNTMPDPVPDRPATITSPQIEDQLIPLPSNGNIGPEYAELEISHRITHADHHIDRIRVLIAEKSFQYSHVIRVSPRKGVNTRSRSEVKKLNLEIAVHCRLYTQCRARLIRLSADPETLNRFRILTTEDVKASTAVVNPNETGSTRLKLSWIWETAGGHRWGLASDSLNSETGGDQTSECRCIFDNFWTHF